MGLQRERALCDELKAWCEANGLPHMSADEFALRDGLSEAQRGWLEGFCERWDLFMSSEQARNIPLKTGLELAGVFVSVLRETLGEEHFGLCMTGRLQVDDACDGNVVMATAFLRLHGRDPWLPSDVEGGRCDDADLEKDCRLWNEAMAIFNSQVGRER